MAKIDDVQKQLNQLAVIVSELDGKLTVLTTKLDKPEPVVLSRAIPAAATSTSAIPIPSDYRQTVDTILNQSFGIEIRASTYIPGFDFSIMVPQAYSNAGKPHWETYKEDRRSRVILSALGLNGVREWTQKVYDNFDTETKTRITMDRTAI